MIYHIALSDSVFYSCILFLLCINSSHQDHASMKHNLVMHAQLAYQTKLYGRAANYFVEVVNLGQDLTREEDELLDNIYRSIVNARRGALRSLIDQDHGSEARKEMVREFQKKTESQLKDAIDHILRMLHDKLIPKSDDISKIFYLKMLGDYNRYLAENQPEEGKKAAVEESKKAYLEAFELSKQKLEPTDYDRLSVAQALSILYYNELESLDEAIEIAGKAVEDARDHEIKTTSEGDKQALRNLEYNLQFYKKAVT